MVYTVSLNPLHLSVGQDGHQVGMLSCRGWEHLRSYTNPKHTPFQIHVCEFIILITLQLFLRQAVGNGVV
jgi:hypothetical protein